MVVHKIKTYLYLETNLQNCRCVNCFKKTIIDLDFVVVHKAQAIAELNLSHCDDSAIYSCRFDTPLANMSRNRKTFFDFD